MKKIVCELCEGTEFAKEGGMFVCQGCGTKYTLEEAKNMMREVEGSAPATAAPVIPVGNPNQVQIDNLLLLASNAYSAKNNEETEKYCNRVIEYDAMCYKAWMLKGKAIGWSSKLNNNRIAEAAHSFKQAVDFAPDEEKECLTAEAVEELKHLGLACISLRQERFSKYPDTEELNGFLTDMEPLIDGMVVLLSKQNDEKMEKSNQLMGMLGAFGNNPTLKIFVISAKAKNAGVPSDFLAQVTVMMGKAAIEGFKTASNKFANSNHPVTNDLRNLITEVDNCISLTEMAINVSENDYDGDIKRYENKIRMEEYLLNAKAFANYSDTIRTMQLDSQAREYRRKKIDECRTKIKERQNKQRQKAEEERQKAEAEKQARIAAYWEAHADEKAALEAEKKELEAKKDNLVTAIGEVYAEINKYDPKSAVPSEAEDEKIRDQIRTLEYQRSKLGMFAGKQKKQITEEIASLNGRRDSLKSKIEDEKKARQAEADKKMAPLKEKVATLQSQMDTVEKRIKAIAAELTKDPEA